MQDRLQSGSAFAFARDGFMRPFPLFSAEDCRAIASHFGQSGQRPSGNWSKSLALKDRFILNLASHPRLLALLAELIGDNIVLWGSSFVMRQPGDVHPWHTDIESSTSDGFASVWIGLENTCRESALQLMSRSNGFGKTIQQELHERDVRRGTASDDMVLSWARDLDAGAELVQFDMKDGDALVFDGRLWHAGPNDRPHGARTALLLQYAAAGIPIAVPDFAQLEWPFRFKSTRARVVLLQGDDSSDVNELVPLASALTTRVYHLGLPLAEDSKRRWKPYPMFNGATPVVEAMSCHTSVLSSGHSPHPPHAHGDEELLIMLQGEAELIISDSPAAENARTERLRPGSFIYYPAGQHHTIRNSGPSPITYLMFKWRGDTFDANGVAPTGIHNFRTGFADTSKPFHVRTVFEQKTAYLGKLHAHLSTLQPGAGYAPHIDAHDVAILVLSGEVETLDATAKPHGVIYYSAGQAHGLRNAGKEPAEYLVFEFHAAGASATRRKPPVKRKTARERAVSMLSGLGLLETARRARDLLRRKN
jgi:quercetin dioxygenase-like cupin family protein